MLTDQSTLKEVRDWLRQEVKSGGATCPACDQFAKVYRRNINSTQARALIIIYRECGRSFGYLPDLRMHMAPHHSNEEPKLRFWGLLEEEQVVRPDGGRAGWWRVTALGEQFVFSKATVPKYAMVYNDRCLNLQGPRVSIRHCLGQKFNYSELMAA